MFNAKRLLARLKKDAAAKQRIASDYAHRSMEFSDPKARTVLQRHSRVCYDLARRDYAKYLHFLKKYPDAGV